jgi:ElaB/YqjD/DUF883 family membrane-anchored ribosome-binding protein
MFKMLTLVVGLAIGAAGAAAWLLSSPEDAPANSSSTPAEGKVGELKARVQQALEEGKRAAADTESRLRQELDAYRTRSDPPAG